MSTPAPLCARCRGPRGTKPHGRICSACWNAGRRVALPMAPPPPPSATRCREKPPVGHLVPGPGLRGEDRGEDENGVACAYSKGDSDAAHCPLPCRWREPAPLERATDYVRAR